MGDTVGCALCIEPEQGKFNEAAFQASGYTLATAKSHGMRLIIPLVGDCATCIGGGLGQYLAWNRKANALDFVTDPGMIAASERPVNAVLNHRNTLTGIRYRDDPTIMAWENCNMCGLIAFSPAGDHRRPHQSGRPQSSLPRHHGNLPVVPEVLDNPSVDLVTFEFYPHWDALLGPGAPPTTAATFSKDAATVTAHGKVFIANEFGWTGPTGRLLLTSSMSSTPSPTIPTSPATDFGRCRLISTTSAFKLFPPMPQILHSLRKVSAVNGGRCTTPEKQRWSCPRTT